MPTEAEIEAVAKAVESLTDDSDCHLITSKNTPATWLLVHGPMTKLWKNILQELERQKALPR